MGNLDDKTALIAGGTSGIGYAIAAAFPAEGARVAITRQNVKRLDHAADNSGAGVRERRIDQMTLVLTDQMADQISDTFGSLDTVVLNKGVTRPAPIEAVTEDRFSHLYRTNLKGPFSPRQKLLSILSDAATVVVNGSSLADMSDDQFQGLTEQLTTTTPIGRTGRADGIAKADPFFAFHDG